MAFAISIIAFFLFAILMGIAVWKLQKPVLDDEAKKEPFWQNPGILAMASLWFLVISMVTWIVSNTPS